MLWTRADTPDAFKGASIRHPRLGADDGDLVIGPLTMLRCLDQFLARACAEMRKSLHGIKTETVSMPCNDVERIAEGVCECSVDSDASKCSCPAFRTSTPRRVWSVEFETCIKHRVTTTVPARVRWALLSRQEAQNGRSIVVRLRRVFVVVLFLTL